MDDLDEAIRRDDLAITSDMIEASVAMAREMASGSADGGPTAVIELDRHRRRRVVAMVAGLVLIPATAAAGGTFLARTGEHYAPTTEHDASEVLNVCAPDFPEYAASLPDPADPPPRGTTWDGLARTVARTFRASSCPAGTPRVDAFESGIRAQILTAAGQWHICRAFTAHETGEEATARAEARAFATTMTRQDELGTWGDEGWKADREAAVQGNWGELRHLVAAVDGVDPCRTVAP